MISRTSLADEIDTIDLAIADYNGSKRDCFQAYREQLVESGMAKEAVKLEIEAIKAAIKRRRAVQKDEAAFEEKDALTEEAFEEISARAPRATHARVENTEEFATKTLDPKLAERIAQAVQTDAGRKALLAAVDVMIEREEAA